MRTETNKNSLRFNRNPMNFIQSSQKKRGLRIGYMEATLQGFYLNSLETGTNIDQISDYLLNKFNCKDADSASETFLFFTNEGYRTSYAILLPYLISMDNLEEFENIIRERFFGIERFIQQGKNLYNFLQYIDKRKEPIVWINDLERGIIGWDMGQLVGLIRAAREKEYITKEHAWKYIEKAGKLCSEVLYTHEQIDKSFLIGQAMKSDKIQDWEQLISCYSLLRQLQE